MNSEHKNSVVFVAGGGSGIGMGLASAFHARGATVIIGGRTLAKLEEVAERHPGMETEVLNVTDADSVAACAKRVAERHLDLNVLINNAGVQQLIDFGAAPHAAATLDQEIDINLRGLIYVTNAFLPLLERQESAKLIHVGSGLGYVPLVAAPIYSATKAAVHAFTVALRQQLTSGSIKIIELIPPVVETGLHRAQTQKPPRAMSAEAFVSAAVAGLETGRAEVPVGLAKVLRLGSRLAPTFFLGIVNKPRQ